MQTKDGILGRNPQFMILENANREKVETCNNFRLGRVTFTYDCESWLMSTVWKNNVGVQNLKYRCVGEIEEKHTLTNTIQNVEGLPNDTFYATILKPLLKAEGWDQRPGWSRR